MKKEHMEKQKKELNRNKKWKLENGNGTETELETEMETPPVIALARLMCCWLSFLGIPEL